MKYCTHCGNALDDSAQICMSCGCPVDNTTFPTAISPTSAPVARKAVTTKLTKKHWIIITVSVVALIGLINGGIFLGRYIKKQQILDELIGRTFTYKEYGTYNLTVQRITFIDTEKADYYYSASILDTEMELTRYYTVEFDGGDPYIVMGTDEFYIEFDRHGNIDSLHNSIDDETYE